MNTLALEGEVVIAGAGPAGSSLAGFLRLLGHSVVVVERDAFPRFHVGESLLPTCIPALLELGVDLSKESFALKKPGALFVDDETGERMRFDFGHALAGSFPYAYQVERAPFDYAVAKRAAQLGAGVHYRCSVDRWSESADGVEVAGDWGTCRARVLVDATGQQAVLGRNARSVQALDRFGRCASFSTFDHVESSFARDHLGGGDIVILLCASGWTWLIPLTDGRVSVGLVERTPLAGTTAEEVLTRCIEESAFLSQVFAGAQRIAPFRRITNYSYYNLEPATARTVALGDARAFLDPIFSSGVTVAIATARLLAREISLTLRRGTPLDLRAHWEECAVAYTTFDRLIERFYRPEWVRNVFFASIKEDRLVREFTSILAGDVWRTDNAVQALMLKSRPRTGWGSLQQVAPS